MCIRDSFRIIKDRKICYISSSILLPEESWDFNKNKIKNKHTNSARLNSFLANKFAELQDKVFEHETVSKSTTTRQLKENISVSYTHLDVYKRQASLNRKPV